ncbi:hypothetical protein D9M68_382180 [compost metagenome]
MYIYRGVLQIDLAGLDLGVVEDVIQNLQQRFCGLVNQLQRCTLLRAQVAVGKHLDEPQHPAHWRADLVAHHGQEVILGARGVLRCVSRAGQRGRIPVLVVGVCPVAAPGNLTCSDIAWHGAKAGPSVASVPQKPHFLAQWGKRLDGLLDRFPEWLDVVGMHGFPDLRRAALHFANPLAEQFLSVAADPIVLKIASWVLVDLEHC